eukprot:RCo018213
MAAFAALTIPLTIAVLVLPLLPPCLGQVVPKNANLTWLTLDDSSPISPLRMNPCMVVFGGEVLALGGLAASGRPLSDVWRSKDALTWTNVHASPSFSSRYASGCAVLGNQILIAAGLRGGRNILRRPTRSVWATSNGHAWRRARDGDFTARENVGLVAFRGQFWLVGGHRFSVSYNDVWRTSDPLKGNWIEVVRNAAFAPRGAMGITVFQGRLWIAGGGVTYSYHFQDVWSSSDGKAWVLAVADAAFSGRSMARLVVFQSQLFLLGGFTVDGVTAEVWTSSDGVNWTQGPRLPVAAGELGAVAVSKGIVIAAGTGLEGEDLVPLRI